MKKMRGQVLRGAFRELGTTPTAALGAHFGIGLLKNSSSVRSAKTNYRLNNAPIVDRGAGQKGTELRESLPCLRAGLLGLSSLTRSI